MLSARRLPGSGWLLGIVLVCILGLLIVRIGMVRRNSAVFAQSVPSTLTPADAVFANRENEFAFDLFHAVDSSAGSENSFISPLSVAQAMTMLYDGARGATQSEIGTGMSLGGLAGSEVDSGAGGLGAYVEHADPDVRIEVANALWSNLSVSFQPSYQDECEHYFGATAASLDFNSPSAAQTINGWASTHTHGKITSIVTPEELAQEGGVVLTDAVYFHGKWQDPFDPSQTANQPFTLANGVVKPMPLMAQTIDSGYVDNDEFQAVRLPYGDGDTCMWIVLPKPNQSLNVIARSATAGLWGQWTGSVSYPQVELYLPKFHVDTDTRLDGELETLGIRTVFGPDADLSPMSASPLFVSSVDHKATLDVDEKGTIATAVTTIGLAGAAEPVGPSPPPIIVRVDHPFLCVIQENKSRAILFIGCIRDPQPETAGT